MSELIIKEQDEDVIYINECMTYVPDDGQFFWRLDRPSEHYKMKYAYENFLRDKAGREVVFSTTNSGGYLHVRIGRKKYSAQQIAYILMVGDLPPKGMNMDHIDGDVTNNRWTNLRCVSRSLNNRNAKRRSDNSSGFTGVIFRKDINKFQSRIRVNNNDKHLGYYNTPEEAYEVRMRFIRNNPQFGFTERHGT